MPTALLLGDTKQTPSEISAPVVFSNDSEVEIFGCIHKELDKKDNAGSDAIYLNLVSSIHDSAMRRYEQLGC